MQDMLEETAALVLLFIEQFKKKKTNKPLKRAWTISVPLKSFYKVRFPLVTSQGNSTAVEPVTFDIALGCPVLGVITSEKRSVGEVI